MTRPLLALSVVAAAAAAASLVATGSVDSPPAPRLAAADSPENDLSWRLPRGWRPARWRLAERADPRVSLSAATFRLTRRRPAPVCDPHAIPRMLPPDGALVLLHESRWAAGIPSRLRAYPARPRDLRFPRRAVPLECSGVARAVAFRDEARGFSATLWLGPEAPRSRLREAERLIDSLRVERVPPPKREPWELWPELITEAGDTMHVPPGWTAGSIGVPRRFHRPRLLFHAATEPAARGWRRPDEPATHGVAVWVTEHHRGPVSAAYPSLREDPFKDRAAFQPWSASSRRARGAWLGYRFSVTITVGEDAVPEDVERAYQSAASLALSGGLRDCSRAARQRRPDLCAGAR